MIRAKRNKIIIKINKLRAINNHIQGKLVDKTMDEMSINKVNRYIPYKKVKTQEIEEEHKYQLTMKTTKEKN